MSQRAGFSLVELLIVISIMGVLAAMMLPSLNPSIHDQLHTVARVVAADMAYGRSLAVANNSSYRFSFDFANNAYTLRHSGLNAALHVLPDSPLRSSSDAPTEQTMDLDSLPKLGGQTVRLIAVGLAGRSVADRSTLEFHAMGETSTPQETIIWLTAGIGAETRYMTVRINPITGLATIGEFTSAGPKLPSTIKL